MCTVDFGDVCPVWREEVRTARKAHECDACGMEIQRGDYYLSHASLWEGEWSTEKMCAACWVVRACFADVEGHALCTPSRLVETLRECIADRLPAGERSAPPDWTLELASVLRRYRTSMAGRRRLRRKWADRLAREEAAAGARKRFPWCRIGRVELRRGQEPEVTLLFGAHMFATWEGRSTVSMPPNAVPVWRRLEAEWLGQAWENEGGAQLSPAGDDN